MHANQKVLVISEIFLPTKGGTAVWFDSVYRIIGGKDIHIVTNKVPGSTAYDKDHPNSLHRLSLQRYSFLKPESIFMYLKLFFQSLWIAMTTPITAIHAGRVLPEGFVGLLVSLITFKPFIVYAHGEEITTCVQSLKRKFLIFVYQHAKYVIANSEFTKNELLQLGIKKERIVLINPGVKIQRFQPGLQTDDLRESIGLTKTSKLLLSVGRLSRRKGFDQSIRSLAQLRTLGHDIHLAIIGIGFGNDLKYLTDIVQKLKVTQWIHFLGHVSEADLPRWYNACDIFLMPNREISGDTEGFGMVFIEANACGKPVIAGNSGGTSSAVKDGETGYLVDGTNLESITSKLSELLNDENLRTQLGNNGLKRVNDHFSWEKIAEKTIESVM